MPTISASFLLIEFLELTKLIELIELTNVVMP